MTSISPPLDQKVLQLMREGRFADALPLAERSVTGATMCVPNHGLLAALLLKMDRWQDAERVVAEAADLETGVAAAYDDLAFVSIELGRHDRANDLYKRAIKLSPQTPRFWYNLACSERSFGRLSEAEEACDRCITLDARQHRTYLLRSELRVQTIQKNHIPELQSNLAKTDLGNHAKVFLAYALAKELDDVQRFDEAFHWFAAAAKLHRSEMSYDIARDEQMLRRIENEFPRDAPNSQWQGEPGFIFIMGLPRSGTTLMERILTGLSGVRSNGETQNFSRALVTASTGTGDIVKRAAAADPVAVASRYARLARCNASQYQIIEKLPTNYLYVGAIRRALPQAKLLLLKRSPVDSCFAMYRTLFGDAYPFAYNWDELARYFAAYERLMKHWRSTLGDVLHEIVYEDLVRLPQHVGSVVAEHCGLTWSAEALDIQKNRSVSLTASAAQVRQPIYGSSSGHWRNYRRHLSPLMAALRRNGVSLPQDADR